MSPRASDRRRVLALLALVVVPPLLQTTLVGRLSLRGIGPDLALCSVAIWSMLEGGVEALAVAFLTGVVLDLLTGNALGVSALALLTAASLGLAFGAVLPRSNPIVHVALVVVATIVYYSALMLLVDSLDARVSWTGMAIAVAVPSAIVNVPAALVASELLRRVSLRLVPARIPAGRA